MPRKKETATRIPVAIPSEVAPRRTTWFMEEIAAEIMSKAKKMNLPEFEALGMKLKMLAYYENSLEGKSTPDDGGKHPYFKEYASAFTAQPHFSTFIGPEAVAMLRKEYPPKANPRLPSGLSVWSDINMERGRVPYPMFLS